MITRVLTIMLLVSLATPLSAAELKAYNGDIKHPALHLAGIDGKDYRLADYRGQVVLVQFWATYCSPCRSEMPSMNRLRQRMQGKPFKILAVDMAETPDEVRAFIKAVKPQFTILMDTDGSAIQQWKVFAAPSSFIIGPDGEIRYTLYGAIEWDSDTVVKTLTSLMP